MAYGSMNRTSYGFYPEPAHWMAQIIQETWDPVREGGFIGLLSSDSLIAKQPPMSVNVARVMMFLVDAAAADRSRHWSSWYAEPDNRSFSFSGTFMKGEAFEVINSPFRYGAINGGNGLWPM